MTLSDREIATLIILGALVALILAMPKVRRAAWVVVKTFFSSYRLWALTLVYLIYAGVIVALAWWLGIWTWPMLKDTIIVVLTLAVPMLFRAINAKGGSAILSHAVKETIGVGAIVVFYVNLASFIWPAELLLQVLVIFAAMRAAVAKHQGGKSLTVAKLMDGFNVLVGLAMLIYTTIWLVQNGASVEWWLLLLTFLMTLWLPALMLPFVYGMAFYAGLESLFVALPFFNDRKQKPLKVRLAIIVGMRGSVRLIRGFTGLWRTNTRPLVGWRETLAYMKRYRSGAELDPLS